jgi:hypothetical protein
MKKNTIAGLGIPMFFILPILGFLVSLNNIRSKSSAIVYIAFAMLFGYAISFTDTSADSYRYAEAFARFDNSLDYNRIVEMYQGGELRDMYRMLLFYFVSLFSSNPKVMYAFAGLVYGVLSYLILRIFVKERDNKFDKYIIILTLVFFTYISLANINGFRFNTGALFLFYSTYNFVIQKKMIWALGILISPLFHFGLILIVPIILFYGIIKSYLWNKNGVKQIMITTFIITFILSWIIGTNSINLNFLTDGGIVSGAAGNRINYINSSDVATLVEKRRENSLFLGVQRYFDIGIKFFVFFTVLFINKIIKSMKGNKTEYIQFFTFIVFFYSIAFLASSFPSGGRFLSIAHLFLFLFLGKLYVVYSGRKLKKLIVISLVVFSFNILFTNGLLPILILSSTFWYGNLFWIIIEGLK